MTEWTLQRKLGILVFSLILSMIFAGGIGVWGIAGSNARLKTVYEDRTIPLEQLSKIHSSLMSIRLSLLTVYSGRLVQSDAQSAFDRVQVARTTIDKEWKAYMATYLVPEEKEHAIQFEQQYKQYLIALDEALLVLKSPHIETFPVLIKKNSPLFQTMNQHLEFLIQLQGRVAQEEYQAATSAYEKTKWILILSLLGVGSAAAWFAGLMIRQVLGQLGGQPQEVVAIVQKMAQGDLSTPIHLNPKAHPQSVLGAMTQMKTVLQDFLKQIDANVGHLVSGSVQLAATVSEVSHASQTQHHAASGMAAAVEELTASIAQISDHVEKVSKDAHSSVELIDRSRQLSHSVVGSIQTISTKMLESSESVKNLEQRSKDISGITEAIREIAEQTNLLALNAAIEAARAGEQGRGFAVVADEVRRLAERTRDATAEISAVLNTVQSDTGHSVKLIESVNEEVERSVEQVNTLDPALSQLSQGSKETVFSMSDLVGATREQGLASTEISNHVNHVAEMAEENQRVIAQLDELATQMRTMGSTLSTSLSRFQF